MVASFHNLNETEVDYAAKGYTSAQILEMRMAERFNSTSTLGLTFTKPFKNFPCYSFDFYTTLFVQYNQHGTLPYEGSLSDQPSKIIEIFNILKALLSEAEEKERKKQAKDKRKK